LDFAQDRSSKAFIDLAVTRDGDYVIAPSVDVMRPCTALELEGHAAVFGEARQAPQQDTSVHPLTSRALEYL
jgi:hypothetical protein